MPTLDDYAKAGMAALEEKRLDEAIELFTRAVDIAPNRPDMNNALASAYMLKGDLAAAVPWLEKAVELSDPYREEAHQELKSNFYLELATAYAMLDRVADARRILETAVSLWPTRAKPRLQLGHLLLSSCQLEDGLAVYRGIAEHDGFDGELRDAARAVVEASQALIESEHDADIFLVGHAESYRSYFDQVATEQAEKGWFAEAARMARGDDGEPRPLLPEGARPYALERVDLVDPATGQVSGVYGEDELMVVALSGLEPLAQAPILFPWKTGEAFEVWVCTQVPWHWLQITLQFEGALDTEAKIEAVDGTIGDWYLAGYNGDFGDKEAGRFHYVSDPDPIGDKAVAYTVDLGRAKYDAIPALLRRLTVLHGQQPLRRVLFGQGRLPDA